MRRLVLSLALLTLPVLAAAGERCGAVDAPCTIEGGEYHVALPDGWAGGPAVIHLHGYNGSGAKVIGNTGFARGFTARGYALIAPSALPWRPDRDNSATDWSVRDGSIYPRDDVAFLAEVLADAETRFGIDRRRVLMTGFSRGGSMAWDVACIAPGTAAAFAPVAGAFWDPLPEKRPRKGCAGPVKLLHSHGFTDRLAPLEGRLMNFGGIDYAQGNIFEGLQIWRRVNGCAEGSRAGAYLTDDKLWRKIWTDCAPGAALELALHPGGHGLPKGWATMVLDWFESQLATE